MNALAEHPNPVPGERAEQAIDGAIAVVRRLARAAGQFEAEFARLTRPDRAELPAAYRGTDPLEAIDHYIEEQRVKLRRHEGNWHREAQIEALEVCRQRVAAALARREGASDA